MKFRHILFLMLPLLAACASDDDGDKKERAKYVCPQVAVIHDLEQASNYTLDTAIPDNLIAVARMQKINGDCSYKKEGIDVSFAVTVQAAKGVKFLGDRVDFPYFVSVVNPDQTITAKQMLTVDLRFKPEENAVTKDEKLHVFIPTDKHADGSNYQVLLGFQLTQAQLDAVRKGGN